MYVVTGAAGFIGSNIVAALNERGHTDILAVDDLEDSAKIVNLRNRDIADYLDKTEFLSLLETGKLAATVKGILHQGACTDTEEADGKYMLENNYRYSKVLLDYALTRSIPLVYASSAAVYGNSTDCSERRSNEQPLNVYAYSKFLLDNYARRRISDGHANLVGLRYFNVYGPNETHKGKNASMVQRLFLQLAETGRMELFGGSGGYRDGEQRRDFVYLRDIVDINLHFLDRPLAGIYNAATGCSRSFNDIARILISLHGSGEVEYIPLPISLRGKYQSFTQADLTALRGAGYQREFTTLEDGIAEYYDLLSKKGADSSRSIGD